MNLLTDKQVAEMLSCSRAYVWSLSKRDETFPKPINLGMGTVRAKGTRWDKEAVEKWVTDKQQGVANADG